MADLNVQPKKKSSILPWLLLLAGVIALIYFLSKGCSPAADKNVATTSTTAPAAGNWDNVDFNSPRASYNEITDSSINVQGNDQYGIYGLGENVLFETDNATLKSDAEANLKQIAASIKQRYDGGEVRVFGYTDAKGSADYNMQLAEDRARSVRDWLIKNAGISEDHITMHPVGEARPVASNATEPGRQQNRRVEIVARKGS